MLLRWTALLALVAGSVLLGSCSSSESSPPPTPVITGLFPSSITAGSEMFTIFISGRGFMNHPTSQVFWNGSMRTAVLNSTTNQMVVTILAPDVASAGIGAITVSNPEPGGPSLAATFTINSVQSGTPLISSLSPSSATPGSGGFTLTVNGSNFVAPVVVGGVIQKAGSTVTWNSAPLSTTFVTTNQLTASVPGSNIASAGFASVSVYNTTPGDTQLYAPAVDFSFTSSGTAFPKVASVSVDGGAADGPSAAPAISADGRYVAFFSEAKNLVPRGARGNIFVRDTCMGAVGCTAKTAAVDLAADGSAPDGAAGKQVAMSADGRFVVFESRASNLVSGSPGDPAAPKGAVNLFVRDLCTGANAPSGCTPHTDAVAVGISSKLASGADGAFASISGDGRFIAFLSPAMSSGAPRTGSGSQIFVRDTCAGPTASKACVAITKQIEVDSKFLSTGSEAQSPAISADGRYVAFTYGRLSAGSRADLQPTQVLLSDTCWGSSVPAPCTPSTTEISASPAGESGNRSSGAAMVSGDGRFVVFQSSASNLANVASQSKLNIYLRDTCLGATASDGCTPSTTFIGTESAGISTNSDAFASWISASGRYISFISGHSMSTKRHNSDEAFLFVRDTCFGATGTCAPRTVAVAAPVSTAQTTGLSVGQLLPVQILSNGRIAAFASTSPVPTAPTGGSGDVLLVLTSF